jgi:hypothetical protein
MNLTETATETVTGATVTVGRGTVTGELTHTEWEAFKREVLEAFNFVSFTVTVQSEGEGVWEGVTESNFVVSAYRETELTLTEQYLFTFLIKSLKGKYQQEAISILFGVSNLV